MTSGKKGSGIDWSNPAARNEYNKKRRAERSAPSDYHRGYKYAPKSAHTGKQLTPDRVRDIRRRVAAGESQNAVARVYGLSHGSVSMIVRRITWSDIDD